MICAAVPGNGDGLPSFVVNLITEPRGINDGQRDTSTLLIKFKLCKIPSSSVMYFLSHRVSSSSDSCKPRTDSDRLDLDTFLNVGIGGIVVILMRKDILVAERVDKGGATFRHRDD